MIRTTREYPSYEDDDDFSSSESEEFYHQMDDDSPPPSPTAAAQPPQRKHFCVICNKQFGSGKAYGGHVRIHSSEYLNNKGKVKKMKIKKKKMKKRAKRSLVSKEKEKERDLIKADVEGKIRCCLCDKEFQTMHSLFGHMRRHPDRSWKGVRPPRSKDDDSYKSDEPEDVHRGACDLMVLRYAPLMYKEAMELANLRKSEWFMRGDKSLVVDTKKVKMEIEVDGEDKRSLGFDLNQPYQEEDYDPYWN